MTTVKNQDGSFRKLDSFQTRTLIGEAWTTVCEVGTGSLFGAETSRDNATPPAQKQMFGGLLSLFEWFMPVAQDLGCDLRKHAFSSFCVPSQITARSSALQTERVHSWITGITSLLELTAVCHRRGRQAKVRRINSKMKTKEMQQLATLQPGPPHMLPRRRRRPLEGDDGQVQEEGDETEGIANSVTEFTSDSDNEDDSDAWQESDSSQHS
eukprot:g55904.t1